jgi:hypothetical protein
MPLLLVFLALAFAALPLDAQLWLIGLLRSLPPEVWGGVSAGTITAMFWYSLGWNALATAQYREDIARAEDALQKRRR